MLRVLKSSSALQAALVKQWDSDLKELTGVVVSFCPDWQTKEQHLMKDTALQKSLLANTNYAKVSPAVELLKEGLKHLKAWSSLWVAVCVILCSTFN